MYCFQVSTMVFSNPINLVDIDTFAIPPRHISDCWKQLSNGSNPCSQFWGRVQGWGNVIDIKIGSMISTCVMIFEPEYSTKKLKNSSQEELDWFSLRIVCARKRFEGAPRIRHETTRQRITMTTLSLRLCTLCSEYMIIKTHLMPAAISVILAPHVCKASLVWRNNLSQAAHGSRLENWAMPVNSQSLLYKIPTKEISYDVLRICRPN